MRTVRYLREEHPPVCLHVLGQDLVNALWDEGRQVLEQQQRHSAAIAEAAAWLRENAPGRALEALERAGV